MFWMLKTLRSSVCNFSKRKWKYHSLLYRSLNDLPADLSVEDLPNPTVIKRVLKAKNISFNEGYTCFMIACPGCAARIPKATSRNVYINKATGLFMCSHCKHSGPWNQLELLLSSSNKKKKKVEDDTANLMAEKDKLDEFIKQIRQDTEEIKSLIGNDGQLTKILKKFSLPNIRSDACYNNLDIRIDKPHENLYFSVENAESDVVGYRKLNSADLSNHLTLPTVNYGGLLTLRRAKSQDTAVLVPSVADFLALLNSKVGGSVVCLPDGVNTLSQYMLPSLERFKKVILWLGTDLKSWDAVRHFAKKLGEKRCLFISPSQTKLVPHLVESDSIKEILASARPIAHKSITTFANLRQDVLSDLQNIDKVQGVKWKRYPTLSKILKGHRRGELTVVTGPTGSGKTTFMSEYSLDLAMQGVNTLWGSFEIRNQRLARTMLQQMAGIPLDENLHLFDTWADEFERLPVYFMTFHGQQTIKIVMEAVEHATYVHDIAHVIIDNVQFMLGMADEHRHMDRFWKQDAIVAAFRTFATRQNCHVTLVIHPRKERDDEDLTTNSIFGGAKAAQEADNVLIIQDKRLTSLRGRKYLQVTKNRYSGDLGVMPLDFDKSSLSYMQKKSTKGADVAAGDNKKSATTKVPLLLL